VELLKLQLDAQVQIEVAKSEAMAKALASMNVKMIGDPNAAASLLRMVTLSDGLGEVIGSAPRPLLEIGQQLLNKVTGNSAGDSLTQVQTSNGSTSVTELALLVPEIIQLAEQNLNLNKLKGQSVGDVLHMLAEKVTDNPSIMKAQAALDSLPIVRDLPFEDFYLRAAAK